MDSSNGLFVLAVIGFKAMEPALNTPMQLWGLKFLFAMFPSIFYLSACAIIWHYPITEERHAKMRAELEAKNRAVALDAGA